MKIRWSALASLGVAALLLSSCEAPVDRAVADAADYQVRSEYSQELHDMLPESVISKGKISVVGDPNQPWRVVEVDGTVTGFQVDLMKEFSRILGVEIGNEIVSGLPAVKLGIQAGRNDAAFGPLVSTESTQRDLTFIDYTLGKLSFLYPQHEESIDGYADLCGKSMSYLDGTVIFEKAIERINEACVDRGASPARPLPLADINSVILALSSERAQFAAMSAHQVSYANAENPGKYQYYISAEKEWPAENLGMAFGKSQDQLARAFHAAWQEVFDNGVYHDLMQKYDMASIEVDEPVLHVSAVDD